MAWMPGWETVASAHFWSNVYFALSIVALIMLGVFEVISHRYSEREADLATDQQAQAQHRYNTEIARLHLEASKANERAASLEIEARRLQIEAANAQKDAALANTRAANLEQAAEAVQSALDNAQKRLAEISQKEEDLEKRQSDFLDELTPRQLEYTEFTNDLSGVAPVQIIIEAESDPDSRVFGHDLDAAFRQAKWTQRSLRENQKFSFIPGIWVKYLSSPPGGFGPHSIDDRARTAAQAICRALNTQLLTKARVVPAMTLQQLRQWQSRVPEEIW